MPAVKYSHNYKYAQQQETQPAANPYKKALVKKNVVKNDVTLNKNAVELTTSLNFVLLSIAGVLTILFIGIYSVVALSETRLANLHTKISELNYENTDLENKLENVKSYYSVDNKVSSTAAFEKAKNVLEVNLVNAKTTRHTQPKSSNLNTVTGF